jgi:hypothetical protein
MSAGPLPAATPPAATRPAATLPAASRAPGTRRANRAVLALLGLVLLAAGSAGAAAGFGAFGRRVRTGAVLDPDLRAWVAGHGWSWAAVAAAGVLVALLALRWLLAQGGTALVGTLELEPDPGAGGTALPGRVVAGAVAAEVRSYRGVRTATADLLGRPAAPRLLVRAALDPAGDPVEVRRRIETEAVAHVRAALERPDLPVRLELRLAAGRRRSVR